MDSKKFVYFVDVLYRKEKNIFWKQIIVVFYNIFPELNFNQKILVMNMLDELNYGKKELWSEFFRQI